MRQNPKGSRRDAFEIFLAEIKRDPKYLTDLAEDYFYREVAKWRVEPVGVGGSFAIVPTPSVAQRMEAVAARKANSARDVANGVKRIERMARLVMTFDTIMPNGKKLRHCSREYLISLGGAIKELARNMKPRQLVENAFTEKQFQAIVARGEKKAA